MEQKQQKNEEIGYSVISGLTSHYQSWIAKLYEFSGQINSHLVHKAFVDIFEQTKIFKYKLNKNDGKIGQYKWIEKSEEELKLMNQSQMFATHNITLENQILEINKKACTEIFFNLVIKYYNELYEKQDGQQCIENAKNRIYPSIDQIINNIYPVGWIKHFYNIISQIFTQATYDHGKYSCSNKAIVEMTKKFNEIKNNDNSLCLEENVKRYDISEIIKKVRSTHQNVSKNSIICAFILLAIHNHNQNDRPQQIDVPIINNTNVAIDLVFSLLDIDDEDKYYGNLIGGLKIGFDCKGKSLAQLAQEFQNKVSYIKKNRIHISMAKLAQKFLKDLSFLEKNNTQCSLSITNWTNYQFVNGGGNFLKNCKPTRCFSSGNLQVKSNCKSVYIGRTPMIVIQMEPNDIFHASIGSFDTKTVSIIGKAFDEQYMLLTQNYLNK